MASNAPKTLNEVLKGISKKYGDSVVKEGVEDLTVDGILSLGTPTFDYAIYGGVPEGRIVEFCGPEGGGKAQPLWSNVFTPAGYKKMGDIEIGDTVIDGKGMKTTVIGVFDRGVLPTYKVTFNDGTFTHCAGDHLWKVYNHAYGKKPVVEILTTDELFNQNLHQGCWAYSIDVPSINIWKDNHIDIDPYLLGALIGDGSLSNTLGFTNSEHDVIAKVNNKLHKYGLTLVKYTTDTFDYAIKQEVNCNSHYIYKYNEKEYYSLNELKMAVGEKYNFVYNYINAFNKTDVNKMNTYASYAKGLIILKNPNFSKKSQFIKMLDNYGLLCKSVDKHIPENYLYSSVECRTALLQGLIDTDGYTDKLGATSISTSSKQLSEDIQFLCRSLGCRVSVTYTESPKYTYNGHTYFGNPSWELRLKVPDGLAIATSKKHCKRIANKSKSRSSKWWRSIVNIEYCGEESCRCIMVDSEEHTYLTDDLICTHNTTTAFLTAASYQREELKRNPDNPRRIVLLDNEGTADPVWAKKLGYNMDEDADVGTIIIRPEGQSAEEIFDMALELLRTGEVGLLIFDSIATLVPQQIADESMEKYQMGGIAKSLTRFANTAMGLLRKYKATLIAINQVRENMTGYGDVLTTPGGRAWKHACSMRLMFKRGEFFDEEGNTLTKSAESPAGHVIQVAVLKTKVCRWDRKVGYMHLNYEKGVDILQDTLDVALHFGFIDNSVQGTYKLINPDTGEMLQDNEGNDIKIRGKKNLTTYFREHPDQWKRLYDMCYEKLVQKDDPHIVAFEQMLNVTVDDIIGVDTKNTNLEEL